jgi:hypothetical protein
LPEQTIRGATDAGSGSVLAARLSAQLLSGPPASDPVAVAHRLLAIRMLLGWSSRAQSVDENSPVVMTVNGLFRAFALVRGRAVATWKLAADRVELTPFARLTRKDQAALMADAEDVLRYLGSTSASVKPS